MNDKPHNDMTAVPLPPDPDGSAPLPGGTEGTPPPRKAPTLRPLPSTQRTRTGPLPAIRPPQSHAPGEYIRGYRISEVIGQGKFGSVYRAEDERVPGMQFAVKETLQPENTELFQREFDALKELRHPNLPRYYDLFEEQGRGFLVMDYVPGQNLLDVLRQQPKLADGRREPLSESLVLGSYAVQLSEALLYLHTQRLPILHRDIKPANIRVTPQGLLKLVDFGLLKHVGEETHTDIRGIGTAPYAPLEQYSSSRTNTDHRSDIYSLAALLYHLLTGLVPIAAIHRLGKTPDPLKPPSFYVPGLQPHVSDGIMMGMQLAKQDRYNDIGTFKQALLNPGMVDLPRTIRGHVASVNAVAYSPDGHVLVSTGADRKIRLWHTTHKKALELRGHEGNINTVSYSPYGHQIATGGNDLAVILWSTSDGSQKGTFHGHMGDVLSVAWNPNGQYIGSGGRDHMIQVWRTATTNLEQTLKGHTDSINQLAWSSNGKFLASASDDGTARLWQTSNGMALFVLSGHEGAVRSVQWSPDGKMLATGGADGTVRIWRVRDGNLLLNLRGHGDQVNGVAFTPDGQTVVSVSKDQTIRFWRLADGTATRVTALHTGSINGVVCNPQGRTFAIAADDGTVREFAL